MNELTTTEPNVTVIFREMNSPMPVPLERCTARLVLPMNLTARDVEQIYALLKTLIRPETRSDAGVSRQPNPKTP